MWIFTGTPITSINSNFMDMQENVYNPPRLTKESFWNRMKEQYPDSMTIFCDWIDRYKKEVDWDNLFNAGLPDTTGALSEAPKYHDLPYHLQQGIWICFIESRGGCSWEIDLLNYNFEEDVEGFFREVLEPEIQFDKE
jgi:hypothetical protein